MLRPGGLFITREHDASPRLIPMLDLAHSIFNALTGVSPRANERERRGFRSVLEWRDIVQAAGLGDCMVYEIEKGDPTLDEMLVFSKGPVDSYIEVETESAAATTTTTITTTATTGGIGSGVKVPKVPAPTDAIASLQARIVPVLSSAPPALLALAKTAVAALLRFVRSIKPSLSGFLQTFTSASSRQLYPVEQLIASTVAPLEKMLTDVQPYLDKVDGCRTPGDQLIPKELNLIINALFAKAAAGKASMTELVVVGILRDLNAAVKGDDETEGKEAKEQVEAKDDSAGAAQPPLSPRGPPASFHQELARMVRALFVAMPSLRQPDLLRKAGFSERACAVGARFLGSEGALAPTHVITAMETYLDRQAWEEMRPALQEITDQPTQHTFLTSNLVNSKSPWCEFIMALLGSPKVRFSSSALMMAGWVGLSDFAQMWKVAQQTRKQKRPGDHSAAAPAAKLDREVKRRIQKALKTVMGRAVHKTRMGEDGLSTIRDVGEVIEVLVTKGSTIVDVTTAVRARVFQGNVLDMTKLNLDDLPGVPAREGAGYQLFDISRSLLGMGRAQAERVVTVSYTRHMDAEKIDLHGLQGRFCRVCYP